MIENRDDPRSPQPFMQRRTWTTDREMTLRELTDEITERAEPYEVNLSRGVFVSWYSPETDEEVADRLARMAAWDKRHDEWEREMYAKLKEKFDGQ